MEWKGSLYAQGPIVEQVAVYGNGANIRKGAAVMRGTTLGTNLNLAILATGAASDVIGVAEEPHTNASVGGDTNAAGTVYTVRKVVIDPFAYFRAEFDQTDTMAVASVGSSTVTVSAGETGLQGGWLYAVSGSGAGRLTLIVTDDTSGVYTTKDNMSIASGAAAAWDSTTVLIKIVPKWHQLVKLNTTADAIGTDAAAGQATVFVKDIWIKSDSISLARLNPLIHSGLTGLNVDNVKFYGDIIFRNHNLNTID